MHASISSPFPPLPQNNASNHLLFPVRPPFPISSSEPGEPTLSPSSAARHTNQEEPPGPSRACSIPAKNPICRAVPIFCSASSTTHIRSEEELLPTKKRGGGGEKKPKLVSYRRLMEDKKKDLLRRLTIISIPFVFVAIPSIVIFVGMLSPHAQEPKVAVTKPEQNHTVGLLSTMTGGQMILSCRAAFSGNWEYFHYFILDPYKPQHAYFQPSTDPYAILCKWGYMGSFLQDVVLFNSSAPYAPFCRVDAGGCRYLFQDGQMFLVTGRHATKEAPRQKREKKLVGDVLLRDCDHILGIFPYMCHYRKHDHPYVGKIIGRWKWWFNY